MCAGPCTQKRKHPRRQGLRGLSKRAKAESPLLSERRDAPHPDRSRKAGEGTRTERSEVPVPAAVASATDVLTSLPAKAESPLLSERRDAPHPDRSRKAGEGTRTLDINLGKVALYH